MASNRKNKGSWTNSLFGVLWLGTWFWYLAGIVSIAVSIKHLKSPTNPEIWWFLMKAALPWAAWGLLWTAFLTLTLRPWFMSGSVTAQEVHVFKKGCYILSGFVATFILAALYRWYLPVLNLPENVVFKIGNTCRIISLVLTITATIPIVSFVMAYLIKLSLDKKLSTPVDKT